MQYDALIGTRTVPVAVVRAGAHSVATAKLVSGEAVSERGLYPWLALARVVARLHAEAPV